MDFTRKYLACQSRVLIAKSLPTSAIVVGALLLPAKSFADVQCQHTVINSWEQGAQIELSVTNVGSELSSDWVLQMSISAQTSIANSWSSVRVDNGDGTFNFSSPEWLTPLNPGQVHTFGMVVDHGGAGLDVGLSACFDEHSQAADSDNDGVLDADDDCPNTPIGTVVDGQGCPLAADEDGDGVADGEDQCPGTPVNTVVDTLGCPLDIGSDGDGVNDEDDLCPNTPAGQSVDTQGCSLEQPVLKASLFIHDDATLDSDNTIQLVDVFNQLAAAETNGRGIDLFRQFWDAQNSVSVLSSPINCTGEINGFPILCDRREAEAASFDDSQALQEMAGYVLTAAVNRIDLRRENWQDCGEHRLIYAVRDSLIAQRNFIIFEARVPNPMPGNVAGCSPVIDMWRNIASLPEGADRADLLRSFFLQGIDGMPPAISAQHFFNSAGQIRTNQFMGFTFWLLKENKLQQLCDGNECRIASSVVTVKENPFGPLFDPTIPSSTSPLAAVTAEFQQVFPSLLDPLLNDNIAALSNPVPDHFNHGQSHSSPGPGQENNFAMFFGDGESTVFGNELSQSLQGKVDALGNLISVSQLLARATAMTCGGCHQPSTFGLNQPASIGAFMLANGQIIDSWPATLGFVHVDEARNISPALEDVFIPLRIEAFENVLLELNSVN